MSDHDKLREAIKRLRISAPAVGMCGAESTLHVPYKELTRVLAAAESTLPKTKMVEVWRVEGSTRGGSPWARTELSRTLADSYAERMLKDVNHCCIRVTGPHSHEVPA